MVLATGKKNSHVLFSTQEQELEQYFIEDGEIGIQRLLVYEYMPNRSLKDHLFNRALPIMPWMTRLQIMLGSAQVFGLSTPGTGSPGDISRFQILQCAIG